MIDYHIHTLFSCDSRLHPEEVCRRAIALGFDEIAFTEHLDFDPLDEGYGHYDYSAISDAISSLRSSFAGQLTIRKGVEITFQKGREEEIRTFLDGKEYDYVMGSVHLVGSFDISQDQGTGQFFSNRTREEALLAYFETSRDLVCSGLFDSLAHFEMIRRYALRYSDDYSYGEFSGMVDEVLGKLISQDMVLEVNTSGLRHLPKQTYPRPEIVEKFIALGGRFITVGSDAHLPDHIGYRIPETIRDLKKRGIGSLTTFDRRVKGERHV